MIKKQTCKALIACLSLFSLSGCPGFVIASVVDRGVVQDYGSAADRAKFERSIHGSNQTCEVYGTCRSGDPVFVSACEINGTCGSSNGVWGANDGGSVWGDNTGDCGVWGC